jgi:mRNA interferase RelE/StbE
MHKIKITRVAGQMIKTLPPKQYRQVISTIFSLRENPVPSGSKKLSGDTRYHHIDINEYRIVYRFDTDKVSIAVIGNTNDDEVYKLFAK